MATAVGIDLGTTNSVIAAMEEAKSRSSRTPRVTERHHLWLPFSTPVNGSSVRWPDGKRS
jgi:sugar (pentulose or hexulose) kinase